MKYLIKVIKQGCGWTEIVDEYTKSFKSKDALLGYLTTTEEYLNDGPGLKHQVISEPIEQVKDVI